MLYEKSNSLMYRFYFKIDFSNFISAASVELFFFPRKSKALTVCMGFDYICVSLGVPEPDFVLSVLTVAPPIKEELIKYLIKEGSFS